VLMLDETITMSSDWIAHGIMDSIVDSYFPFLNDIEKEVVNIENMLSATETTTEPQDLSASTINSSLTSPVKESDDSEEKRSVTLVIKHEDTYQSATRTHFSLPKKRGAFKQRFKALMHSLLTFLRSRFASSNNVNASRIATTVRRMARTRRLVTSLTRFLATKSEVVASLKKRLLSTGEAGIGNGTGDDQDVFVYMGDVQGLQFTFSRRFVVILLVLIFVFAVCRPHFVASAITRPLRTSPQ